MYKLLAGCIMVASTAIQAVESVVWVRLGTDREGTIFSVNEGSFSVATTKGGIEIAMQAGREDLPDGSIIYSQWYVIPQDCYSGEGQVVSLTLDGEYKTDYEFSYERGGTTSRIAQVICRSYHLHRDADLKGL